MTRLVNDIQVGNTVTLKNDHEFRGRVLAITGWQQVYLKVLEWAGETGGFRGQSGVLDRTVYPASQLEMVSND